MGGGELQLIAPASTAEAAQMEFIVGQPQMSFFKFVYRRHTNFSMQSTRESFFNTPVLDQSSRGRFTCTFSGRRADALKEIYLCYRLPEVYSDETFKFTWVRRIANYIIYRTSITLDNGRSIDDQYGEWMDVWNELTLSENKKGLYDRMTGNDPLWTQPTDPKPRVFIKNNRLTYRYYPVGAAGKPSIPGRRFIVPLPFWFTKNPALVLPLCALQLQTLNITVETRALDELYQLYDIYSGEYMGRRAWNESHPSRAGVDTSIGRFLSPDGTTGGQTQIALDAYLECQYIFLDRDERTAMTFAHHQMLVEQVFRFEKGGIKNNEIINLTLNNPVKEFIWFFRRADAAERNDWTTFTEKSGSGILSTAKLVWNKNYERLEDKPAEFFEYMQTFQHHSGSPRPGIYTYSFALYPEKWQPSGAYNTAIITANQLAITVNPPPSEDVEYECVVYALCYNVFEAMAGIGGLKFTP